MDSGMKLLTSPSQQINVVMDNIDAFEPPRSPVQSDPFSREGHITAQLRSFRLRPGAPFARLGVPSPNPS